MRAVTCALQLAAIRIAHTSLHNTMDCKSYKAKLVRKRTIVLSPARVEGRRRCSCASGPLEHSASDRAHSMLTKAERLAPKLPGRQRTV